MILTYFDCRNSIKFLSSLDYLTILEKYKTEFLFLSLIHISVFSKILKEWNKVLIYPKLFCSPEKMKKKSKNK